MSTESPASIAILLNVIEILERLQIRYHVGGSFASAIHGVPRQTLDADVVVDLELDHVAPLVAALERRFYVDAGVAAEAVSRRGAFNAVHLESGFKVDFFVKGPDEFDEVELGRSEHIEIVADPPRAVSVKTAEDTVLRKLQWYADGGGVSERQWRDVLGILMTAGESLDREYLRTWADRIGIAELLTRALDLSGEP
jgi:hypothetical protein